MEPQYDIVAAELSPSMLGEACTSHLCSKGFCVVDSGLSPEECQQALTDIEEMDSMGKFATPPLLVSDGLFGQEGSSRIAEMDGPGELSTDGEHLQKIDHMLTSVCNNVCDFLDATEIDCQTRTHALVHETNPAGGDEEAAEPPDMVEREASTWLNTYVRARVMMIVCLGPTSGTMELRPYEDEEAQAVELETKPGSLIILRTDLLSHKHFAHAKSHLLTCHLLEPRHSDKRTSHNAAKKMTPAARAIDNWCLDRLQVLKSAQEFGQELSDIPADFKRAINQVCFKGQRAAVRGVGSKLPGHYSFDNYYSGMHAGMDMVGMIPMLRWDYSEFYDPAPEMWIANKTCVKHMSWADGIDLFDNKRFGISISEAKIMDPHQSSVLEVGYEALLSFGFTKKAMMNSVGGVYLGCTCSDWGAVPKTGELASSTATGGAASITSNRLSFCLGMKGPSMSIDAGDSSGLFCVHVGSEGFADRGRGAMNAYSLSGGIHYNLWPTWWPQFQAAGILSKQGGRCFSFDESADGHVKGDGICFLAMGRLTEVVDGQTVMKEVAGPSIGIIAGSYANSDGGGSSWGSGCGKGTQEAVIMALQNSALHETDIESVESHAEGIYLADAVEAAATTRALRSGEESWDDPLLVSTTKTNIGNSQYCAGVLGVLRCLFSARVGTCTPNVHLQALNPHMDFGDWHAPLTEMVEQRRPTNYVGCTATSFSGTNVHTIIWGRACELVTDRDPPIMNRSKITYWPGGGGTLDDEHVPWSRSGYQIAGTWNRWMPEPMEAEGPDGFAYTLTLGENRWEKFQIWLDGSDSRILHPTVRNGSKGSEVALDTFEDACGLKWAIDGRPWSLAEEPESSSSEALADQEPASIDRGRIGDKYRVHLRVAGKYRTVTWEKLPTTEAALVEKVPDGLYSMYASWKGWQVEEMFRDDSDPGVHYIEAKMVGQNGGHFAIVRNEDMEQIIYPDRYDADDNAAALGPDELGQDFFWHVDGKEGDVYRIEFHRKPECGLDRKKVTWKLIRLRDS